MTADGFTRRNFMGTALAVSLLKTVRAQSKGEDSGEETTHQLFWGDLHNHNAVGYAKGSLERSIELAREHLDFFAFTGHAHWHDMPKMPGDSHRKWVHGFKAHSDHWPKTRRLIQEAQSKDFTALLGYEWHSSEFGDYCLIFAQDQPELFLPDHVDKILDFAQERKALAIPHHVGYKQGWRGANWSYYRSSVSPIVEVFSEHGCTESDRAPHPFIRHSMGGRCTSNTIQPQLARGLRFGLVASSDDHLGYPGAYGEGVLGVWAEDLSPKALFEAFRARRTYAATGDRIMLDVKLNGRPMGSELPAQSERQIDVRVEAQDSMAMVELVRNGRVVERYFPEDHAEESLKLPGRAKCRIQYGWGPWGDLNMSRVCSWDMTVSLNGGRFNRVLGCFQSAPFDENLRDRVHLVSPNEIHLQSHTTREKCFAEDPTKALICELEGGPDAILTVQLNGPVEQTVKVRLVDLIDDNRVTFTGVFTSESYIIHRLVGPSEYSATIRWKDKNRQEQASDWYCVRVTQHNGHVAWSSPIWVG
ncbi:MAG: DUF3604 domain-containing protein [Acidobacteriota bacterium]